MIWLVSLDREKITLNFHTPRKEKEPDYGQRESNCLRSKCHIEQSENNKTTLIGTNAVVYSYVWILD